jgi:aminoglycoside 6'-N-acetyltransferase I
MRQALWPSAPGEHAAEIEEFFAGRLREPLAVLMAFDERGTAVGFIELSIRTQAEGCDTDRVAYVEGWYVEPASRRLGVGTELMRAAEAWGRSQGCTELASDTESDNLVSAAAHRATGFDEVGLIRCFRRSL